MNTSPKTIYINFCYDISQEKVIRFMSFCTQIIREHKPDILYFTISSPGGQVAIGITLYNFLISLPAKIVMHNIGSVNSVATVVFLAGEERYSNEHSSFLFHGVQLGFQAQISLTMAQIKEKLSGIEEDQKKLSEIITERTKLSSEEISQLFLQGEVKTPDWAQEKGFINEITQLSIPQDADHFSFNM